MAKKVNPRSLANLNPRNRYQGKERFNTTLRPETIAWLQSSGNASGRIEELVQQAKSGNTHELESSDNAHDQSKGNDSHYAHELKELTDRLYQAEETMGAVAGIMRRWEADASSHKASSPRWENVVRLLAELRTELHP